jgi:hypothetical protein
MWDLLEGKTDVNMPFTINDLKGNIQQEIAAIPVDM